jgi:hypothetical protein
MSYKEKYLKYKTKYSLLKEQKGGDNVQLFGQNSFPFESPEWFDYNMYFNKAIQKIFRDYGQKVISIELFSYLKEYIELYRNIRNLLDDYIFIEDILEFYRGALLHPNYPIIAEHPKIDIDHNLVKKRHIEKRISYYKLLHDNHDTMKNYLSSINLEKTQYISDQDLVTFEAFKRTSLEKDDSTRNRIRVELYNNSSYIPLKKKELEMLELDKLRRKISNYEEMKKEYASKPYTHREYDAYLEDIIQNSLLKPAKEMVKQELIPLVKKLYEIGSKIMSIPEITQQKIDDTKKDLEDAVEKSKKIIAHRYDFRSFEFKKLEIPDLPEEDNFKDMDDFYSYYSNERELGEESIQSIVRRTYGQRPELIDLKTKIEANAKILNANEKNSHLTSYQNYISGLYQTILVPVPPILRIKPGDTRLELSWEKPTWPGPEANFLEWDGINISKILDYNFKMYSGSELILEQTTDVLDVVLVSNLTNGTTYTCYLTARNSVGSSQPFKVEGVPKASLSIPSTSSSVKVDTK